MNGVRRFSALVVPLLAGALLLSACSEGAVAPAPTPTPTPVPIVTTVPATTPAPTPTVVNGVAPFLGQKLTWRTCVGKAQCANLTVPLDYSKPDGSTLQLQLIKRSARDTKNRRGAIVVNPGGPGGSGYDYVAGGTGMVGSSVSEVFDVVGFDPRGVARSAPVKCLTPKQSDVFYAYDGSPDSDAEATGALLVGRDFANSCKAKDSSLIPFLGTRESAQDLEVLRSALGETKLNYLGKSYGTFLGAQYAERFPTSVGRFVLDGAIDPSLDADAFAAGQALGFERALQSFLADCVRRSSCPLGRNQARAEDRLNTFLQGVDARPLTVGDRELTQALATLGVIASFYSKSSWPRLRTALAQGLGGNGTGLLELSDFYSNRTADGRYSDNSLDAFYAISCLDRPDPKGVDATQALAVKLTETVSNAFGAYLAWGNTPCQSWPVKATLAPAKVSAAGSAPIVVVGTTRDPATPYEWSVALADQLQNAALVTRNGDGHTGYREGSGCTDSLVDAYLLRGIVPEDGVRCSR